MQETNEQLIETKEIKTFLFKYKYKLLRNAIIAAVLTAVTTFFIPKEYNSFGIVYPTSSPSLEISIENQNFGYDVESDRIIQILQSQIIKDSVSAKFNLIDYFEIDKNDIESRDKLSKKFKSCIQFERTNYMSVMISAQTKDPELSANIVNYIIDKVNERRELIYKQNVKLAYDKTLLEFNFQKHLTDSILSILKTDLETLNLSGLLVLASNTQLNLNDLSFKQNKLENINIGVNIINYRHQLDCQVDVENKLRKIKKTLDNPIPKLYVIDTAQPYYKKVFPSYSANVITAILLTLFFSTIVLFSRKENN
jgi:uncharacterized protein involved in exopolysaccharide biosynthesis